MKSSSKATSITELSISSDLVFLKPVRVGLFLGEPLVWQLRLSWGGPKWREAGLVAVIATHRSCWTFELCFSCVDDHIPSFVARVLAVWSSQHECTTIENCVDEAG